MRGGDDGFTYTTLLPRSPDGNWYPPKVGDSAEPPTYRIIDGCTELLDAPGEFRVYLVHYDTRSAAGGGCGCVDQVALEAQFTVVAGGADPCDGKENEITAVSTESGAPSELESLQGSQLSPGQTLTADTNVELTMGDGAIVRIEKGTSFKVTGCDWSKQPERPLPFTMRLNLLHGWLWSKVPGKSEHVNISTERFVAGVRGTIFWISVTPRVTTLHVDKGTVILSPAGKGKCRPLSVAAGHTATAKGSGPPVVRKTPISNKPPF